MAQAPIGPTRESERITSLDVVRGIAIFGILPINLISFGLPMLGGMDRPYFLDDSAGEDSVTLEDMPVFTGFATILGQTGDDLVRIVRLVSQNRTTDSLAIDGGAGADDIEIQTHGSIGGLATDYIIDVHDSGAADDGARTGLRALRFRSE